MNLVKLGIVLGTLLLSARVGAAQEDPDKLKNKILKKVEDRLRAEEDRILKEISKMLDEELSGWKGGEKKTVVKPKKEGKAPAKKESNPPKEPGFLGVFPAELEAEEKKEFGVKSGVILREIVKPSPAEKAGLKEGDIIVRLDGNVIDDLDSFRDVILDKGAGSRMRVGFLRDGKEHSLIVILASRHKMEEEREEEHGRNPREPEKNPGEKEVPKRDRTEKELREKTRKFLEEKRERAWKQEEEKKENPGELPGLDFLTLDEEAFESIRGMLEQFGMDPEQFFEQGDDGKWRPSGELKDMFKKFDLRRFFKQFNQGPPEKLEKILPPATEKAPRGKMLEKKKGGADKAESVKPEMKKVEKEVPARKPGWIGIVPVELSGEESLKLNLDSGVGMVITEVIEDSPAEKAKLLPGDVITHINGKPLLGEEGLVEFVRVSKAGQKATFTIRRDGKKKKIRITLGERKQ